MNGFTVSEEKKILKERHASFEERTRMLQQIEEQEREAKERMKKSPFRNFIQLNRDNLLHVMAACLDNPQAARLLFFILAHMDKANSLICSYQTLEEQLGVSQATIARSIKYLKEKGFLVVYKSGTSNEYVVNNRLAWTDRGDKMKYCRFPEEMILEAAEQEEIIKAKKLQFRHSKVMLSSKKQDSENSF